MTDSTPRSRFRLGRRRFAPVALVAGVVASAAIATSMTGTLGAFVAQITNNNNSAANGVLTMSESGPNNNNGSASTVTCNSTDGTGGVSNNAYTCTSINKYGASTTMVPGSSVATSVTITNTGTVTPTTFTLQPGVCSQSNNGSVNGNATDLCSKMTVQITKGATTILAATPLSTFGGTTQTPATATSLTTLAPNATATYTFTVAFPSTGSNATDNTYQGLKASQTLAWTFTS